MVATRAAVYPHDIGKGEAKIIRQGAHRERRRLPLGPGRIDEEKQPGRQKRSLLPPFSPSPQAFCQLYDEEDAVWGTRFASVAEPWGPQGKVQQQDGEKIFETLVHVIMLSDLDAPVPQMVDQLVGVLQPQFSACVQPVITAPKITLPESCAQRSVLFVLSAGLRGRGRHFQADRRRPSVPVQKAEAPHSSLAEAQVRCFRRPGFNGVSSTRSTWRSSRLCLGTGFNSSSWNWWCCYSRFSPVQISALVEQSCVLPGQGSTAYFGARHQGFPPGQVSPAFCGAEHHRCLPGHR